MVTFGTFWATFYSILWSHSFWPKLKAHSALHNSQAFTQ